MIHQVPGVNIEDVPDDIADTLWPQLDKNGGNCITVDADSLFGKWLTEQGVEFKKSWDWIVVWR